MANKIRIDVSDGTLGTTVYVDDVKVEKLRGVTVRHYVGEVSSVILELVASPVEIIGDVSIVERTSMDDKTKRYALCPKMPGAES